MNQIDDGLHMEICQSSKVPQVEWDDLLRSSDDVWFWHSWTWIEDVARAYSLENRYFVARENGRNVGALPMQMARLSLHGRECNRAYSLMMGCAGPFCIRGLQPKGRERILSELTKAAIDWARKTNIQVLVCSLPPLALSNLRNNRGVNPLVTAGWRDVSGHTLIANLSNSESDLWSDLSHDARRSVKLAGSAGYTAERANWIEMLDEYYRVYLETYGRTGGTPHPKGYIEALAKTQEQGNAVFWVGRDPKGRSVAFHSDARFRGGSWYSAGCCETEHLQSGVNYLLLWNAIVEAKRDGCKWYEIGEVYPQTEQEKLRGLTVFKSKFGGEMYRSYQAEIRLFDWPPSSSRLIAAVLPAPLRRFLKSWLLGITRS